MIKDQRGVAGFFVDIPALLVIMIGLSVFTVSIYRAQSSYADRVRDENWDQKLADFMDMMRKHDLLAHRSGVFSVRNLAGLNDTTLIEAYNTSSMGFNYRIQIIDNDAYLTDHSRTFQTAGLPLNKDIYADETSIVLRQSDGRTHLSSMMVSIWEVD